MKDHWDWLDWCDSAAGVQKIYSGEHNGFTCELLMFSDGVVSEVHYYDEPARGA